MLVRFFEKKKSWYNNFKLRLLILFLASLKLKAEDVKMNQNTHIYIQIKKYKNYRCNPTVNPLGFLRLLEVSNG